MKNLVLSALLVATASQAAGCIIFTDDPNPGTLTANLIVSSAGGGMLTTRPGDGVRLRMTGNGLDYTGIFNARSGSVTTPDVFNGGTYTFWAEYINDFGGVTTVVDQTNSTSLTIDGDRAVDVNMAVGNGFFTYNWALENEQGNAITQCSQVVGENGVSMRATLAGTATGGEDLFDCETGFNSQAGVTSDPLAIGDYVVVGRILNANNQPLGTSQAVNASIRDGNEYKGVIVAIRLGD